MVVINLLGEPCCGKSYAATYITPKLRNLGLNVEYVPEFAKQKVYENNKLALKCQEYMFGVQSYMLAYLEGKVDVAIMDSPLILSAIYNTEVRGKLHLPSEHFNKVVMSAHNRYDNLNFLLQREYNYVMDGRVHNENDAKRIRKKLISFLDDNDITYYLHRSVDSSYEIMIEEIMDYINNKKKEGSNNEN